MENLAPSLEWTMQIRCDLESGVSMMASLQDTLSIRKDDFSQDIKELLSRRQLGTVLPGHLSAHRGVHRLVLLDLIDRGLAGEPVLAQLKEFEKELTLVCESEMDNYLGKLPVRVMIVVLLFQFPAFLILLLGPLLNEFTKGF